MSHKLRLSQNHSVPLCAGGTMPPLCCRQEKKKEIGGYDLHWVKRGIVSEGTEEGERAEEGRKDHGPRVNELLIGPSRNCSILFLLLPLHRSATHPPRRSADDVVISQEEKVIMVLNNNVNVKRGGQRMSQFRRAMHQTLIKIDTQIL